MSTSLQSLPDNLAGPRKFIKSDWVPNIFQKNTQKKRSFYLARSISNVDENSCQVLSGLGQFVVFRSIVVFHTLLETQPGASLASSYLAAAGSGQAVGAMPVSGTVEKLSEPGPLSRV